MQSTSSALMESNCPTLTLFKKGKVREVYDLGEHLLFVASDRVSAFDFILPTGIPGKGALLTQASVFWFNQVAPFMKSHLVTADFDQFPAEVQPYREQLEGRTMLVKKTQLIEVECIVRGYIAGSGWKDYQQTGSICGYSLPSGLQLASKLPEPIFTPATKAEFGDHDENISYDRMVEIVGADVAQTLKEKSLQLYQFAHDHMAKRGIILADTKFEFGVLDGEIILIDEVLTPDSSRYWDVKTYQEGVSPPSFDKQIIRDYLEATWDKQPPAPELPRDIVQRASERYQSIFEIITTHT